MGQIITPKECPMDKRAPEICCNIPEINDHAPKPAEVLTELKKVVITQKEAEYLISSYEQTHSYVNPQVFPTYSPVTESVVTVTPCTLHKRTFGNQGHYEILPVNDCQEEKVKDSKISREFFIYTNKQSSYEMKKTDTHHVHVVGDVAEVQDHSAAASQELSASDHELTPAAVVEDDGVAESSPFGSTYGTPQSVHFEHTTEVYQPEEEYHHVPEETKYGEFFFLYFSPIFSM